MPVLKKDRPTQVVTLLSDPTAEVTLYKTQNYGDYLAIQKAAMGSMKVGGETKDNQLEADLTSFMQATLIRMVVSWNFTDESGAALPVTIENIELLDKDDALLLFSAASAEAGLPQDEKSVGKGENS
jgi:hypothetical protein